MEQISPAGCPQSFVKCSLMFERLVKIPQRYLFRQFLQLAVIHIYTPSLVRHCLPETWQTVFHKILIPIYRPDQKVFATDKTADKRYPACILPLKVVKGGDCTAKMVTKTNTEGLFWKEPPTNQAVEPVLVFLQKQTIWWWVKLSAFFTTDSFFFNLLLPWSAIFFLFLRQHLPPIQ